MPIMPYMNRAKFGALDIISNLGRRNMLSHCLFSPPITADLIITFIYCEEDLRVPAKRGKVLEFDVG